ncbi:MAG: response regulator [Solirubrobacteraceae bacterium]|nr:response regulator [Solirubrobacteraceae bacterium]
MARVCLSEPDPETRELLTCLLQRIGHEVVERDADIIMIEPVLDGPGAIGLARCSSPGARLLICSIAWHDRARLEHLDADAFLLKPFGLAELRSVLDALQDGAHAGGLASSSRNLRGVSGRAK